MTQEALKLALEALEKNTKHLPADFDYHFEAITAIKEALAQTQEPVALPCCGYTDASAVKWNPFNNVVQCHNCGQVYTTPPQRKPLDDQTIELKAANLENATSDVKWGFEQGAKWAREML